MRIRKTLVLLGFFLTLPVVSRAETTTTESTVVEKSTGVLNFTVHSSYNLESTDIFQILIEDKNGELQSISCDAFSNQDNTIDYELEEGNYTVDSIQYQGLNMDISTHVYGVGKSFTISDDEVATLPLYINVNNIPEDTVLENADAKNTEENTTTKNSEEETTEKGDSLSREDIVEEMTTEEEEEDSKIGYRSFPLYKLIFILFVFPVVGIGSYFFYKKNM